MLVMPVPIAGAGRRTRFTMSGRAVGVGSRLYNRPRRCEIPEELASLSGPVTTPARNPQSRRLERICSDCWDEIANCRFVRDGVLAPGRWRSLSRQESVCDL